MSARQTPHTAERKCCPISIRSTTRAIRSERKTENGLDRLEKMGVIRCTEEQTDWVNALVIVEKPNGSPRLCLDPKYLNARIKREHYHLPHKSEIVADMAGAQFFSKLDASQGFYQMQLCRAQ